MAAYICKQPNGLYCRFSSVTDCPTHWNMTEEEYEARDILKNHLVSFERIIEDFEPNNMTLEEFDKFLENTVRRKV